MAEQTDRTFQGNLARLRGMDQTHMTLASQALAGDLGERLAAAQAEVTGQIGVIHPDDLLSLVPRDWQQRVAMEAVSGMIGGGCRGLLVLVGPTGSGKSIVMDAAYRTVRRFHAMGRSDGACEAPQHINVLALEREVEATSQRGEGTRGLMDRLCGAPAMFLEHLGVSRATSYEWVGFMRALLHNRIDSGMLTVASLMGTCEQLAGQFGDDFLRLLLSGTTIRMGDANHRNPYGQVSW
jgi:hypothetical protein